MSYVTPPNNLSDATALGMGRMPDRMADETSAQREMPKYVSHKQVWALKIKDICYDRPPLEGEPRGNATITPAEDGYAPFLVDEAWAMKHRPQLGGYYVVYADGYMSFSPADAFEQGYTRI